MLWLVEKKEAQGKPSLIVVNANANAERLQGNRCSSRRGTLAMVRNTSLLLQSFNSGENIEALPPDSKVWEDP